MDSPDKDSLISLPISLAVAKRASLSEEFQRSGIRPVEPNVTDGSGVIRDFFEHDDAGKGVETALRVQTRTAREVSGAIIIAGRHDLGVMAIGAKTSALAVFEMEGKARLAGLKGIVGIEFVPGTVTVPEFDETKFELVRNPDSSICILRSRDYLQYPHRVIAHTAVTIDQINAFLAETFPSDPHSFQIMPDPTSKDAAQIGGIVTTGAEGGNRVKASDDLLECTVVDADGEIRNLIGDDAKRIVGLNGTAGILTQATFEATAFPKNKFGLLIPVKGTREEVWTQILQVQEALKPYCVSKGQRECVGTGENGDIVTGVEIMGSSAIRESLRAHGGTFSLADSCDTVLYVTVASLDDTSLSSGTK